jgi:hypothetical protein
MTTRKALGTIGNFLHQVKEGGKRRLDIAGYDAKALDKKIADQNEANNEHWHKIVRPCLIDAEQRR